MCCVYDIPTRQRYRASRRTEVDVESLAAIMALLPQYPDPIISLEWPSTRPDESSEASKNFGVGLGQLEALCAAHGSQMNKLAPNKWKGDLGLPGKKEAGVTPTQAAKAACQFAADWIPNVDNGLVFGPRGGPKDGRAEAMLMAWHAWSRTADGMRVIAERYGRGSVQAQAFTLMAGSRRRGRRPLNLPM